MNTATLFSSKSVEWATPQGVFDDLNAEFHFTLDACAGPTNAKVNSFMDTNELWSALVHPWRGTVWCNPPYGRNIGTWVGKARSESLSGSTVVMLLPAQTDTDWFHRYVLQEDFTRVKANVEIRFIRGRLKFGGAKHNAPFPSMVVVFRQRPR